MERYPFRTLVAAAAALAMALSSMLLGFPILLALVSGRFRPLSLLPSMAGHPKK